MAELRIFNPDGSEAELSGNAREAVLYLRAAGWTDANTFTILTKAGEVTPTITGPAEVSMAIGRLAGLGRLPEGGDDADRHAQRRRREWSFRHVNVGNPQCVIDVGDEIEGLAIGSFGTRSSGTRCFRTAPTSPSSASTAPACGPGSSSAGWGRPSPRAPAPAAPQSRPSSRGREPGHRRARRRRAHGRGHRRARGDADRDGRPRLRRRARRRLRRGAGRRVIEWLANPLRDPELEAGDDDAPLRFHRALPGYAPSALIDAPELAAEGCRPGPAEVRARALRAPVVQVPRRLLGRSATARRSAARPGLELIAATDGNHGRAVARVARLAGLGALILVPAGTATARIDAIADEGAEVEVVDGSTTTRSAAARRSPARAGCWSRTRPGPDTRRSRAG